MNVSGVDFNGNNLYYNIRNFNVQISDTCKLFVSADTNRGDFEPSPNCELFVNRIPKIATENELIPFFEKAGFIYKLNIILSNGFSRGYGYVTYYNEATANIAKKVLTKTEFMNGKFLVIENSSSNCRIFVGGIPPHLGRDEIWQELLHRGFHKIVDVICYRSYTPRAQNRGFIFLEFQTHAQAVVARNKLKNMIVWGKRLIVDWSLPLPEVEQSVMNRVKIIFLRNLDVNMKRSKLLEILLVFVKREKIEKVYKFKNFSFVHMVSRKDAEYLLRCLKYHFRDAPIEVDWAKPLSTETNANRNGDLDVQCARKEQEVYETFCYDPIRNKTFMVNDNCKNAQLVDSGNEENENHVCKCSCKITSRTQKPCSIGLQTQKYSSSHDGPLTTGFSENLARNSLNNSTKINCGVSASSFYETPINLQLETPKLEYFNYMSNPVFYNNNNNILNNNEQTNNVTSNNINELNLPVPFPINLTPSNTSTPQKNYIVNSILEGMCGDYYS